MGDGASFSKSIRSPARRRAIECVGQRAPGFFNAAIAYVLLAPVGNFELRKTAHA